MKFLFALHPSRDEAREVYGRLSELIASRGSEVTEVPEEADFTVAIGGDGTIAGAFQRCKKPIIGINAGTLGFLSRVEPENAEKAINAVIDGEYTLEERMTLECRADGGEAKRALNEVALLKPSVGPVRISVKVDGVRIIEYQADGVIVATPTGSTGYSLSAGGPIIEPEAEMLLLNPVAPHTLVNRAVVLSHKSEITLECATDCVISIDGQPSPLAAGTPVTVRKSPEYTSFVTFGRENFVDRIRRKLS